MKRYLILLCICLCTFFTQAQDQATYDKVVQEFQKEFNAQNVDAIFAMYTSEMQEAMTKDGVTRFVKGCHEQFGNLKSLTFVEATEGVYSYSAEFEKMPLLMEVQLNPEGKIATIQFQEP